MALKFRLKGLAETFIDSICCNKCGFVSSEDDGFTADETKVTFDGIVVVVTCKLCGEVFVPATQRLGIVNSKALREAVIQDSQDTGEPLLENLRAVRMAVEKTNASRSGDLH